MFDANICVGRYHLPDHTKLMRDWSTLGGDAEKQMEFMIEKASLLFQTQQVRV